MGWSYMAPPRDSAPRSPVLGDPGPCAIEKAQWGVWLLIKKDLSSKLAKHLFPHPENPGTPGPCPPKSDADY